MGRLAVYPSQLFVSHVNRSLRFVRKYYYMKSWLAQSSSGAWVILLSKQMGPESITPVAFIEQPKNLRPRSTVDEKDKRRALVKLVQFHLTPHARFTQIELNTNLNCLMQTCGL